MPGQARHDGGKLAAITGRLAMSELICSTKDDADALPIACCFARASGERSK